MNTAIRHPAVAGTFYPRERGTLAAEVQSYLSHADAALPSIGVLAPHAGYMYSGAVAGAVFAATEIPETCIVLCPNHTGKGAPLSVLSGCSWETPLGIVEADERLAEALKEQFPLLTEDTAAHRQEHGIEVELPFLLKRNPRLKIVPITLGTRQYEVLESLGDAIADVVGKWSIPVLIVASSDMNHYENDVITRVKDGEAIDRLLALDPRGLFDVVMREDISMCGLGPAVVMLTAARRLGAKSAQLIRYATSGDVSGDRDRVVGYAGLVVR
jgi:AmmeMemoRadiSam system protein B